MKKLLSLAVWLMTLIPAASSQDYKGLWVGHITEYDYEINSKYILQIKEHKGNIISGSAYIYSKDYFVFKGLLDFIGTVDMGKTKVTELAIIRSDMPTNMARLCIKYMNLSFGKVANVETLTGDWEGYTDFSNCRPGEVFLQRYKFDDPSQKDAIPGPVMEMIRANESPKMTFFDTELTPPQILDVSSVSIEIEIRDYLREDLDTVSVYLNRKEIISKLPIKRKPFYRNYRLDKVSGLNEIIVYAENLGQVPPNTCTLTVFDGTNRQRVNIFSSKQSSAVIYLNFKKQSKNSTSVPNPSNKQPLKTGQKR
jgi:hypothetical protein